MNTVSLETTIYSGIQLDHLLMVQKSALSQMIIHHQQPVEITTLQEPMTIVLNYGLITLRLPQVELILIWDWVIRWQHLWFHRPQLPLVHLMRVTLIGLTMWLVVLPVMETMEKLKLLKLTLEVYQQEVLIIEFTKLLRMAVISLEMLQH